MIRAAAVQFGVGTDVTENLATCLRMIDQAAERQPDLVVLPEFCNRLSWYSSKDEARDQAIHVGGNFLSTIQAKVRSVQFSLVLNCTVKRAAERITITSFLIGPDGEIKLAADKQTLMGRENLYFDRHQEASATAATPIGNIGLFMCRDGVTMETARMLAIQGAQILCNSLNSFALDEASLHIPVRAPENKVFVVAANKVGPLIPVDELVGAAKFLGVAPEYLYGAGESQIVAPDGRVLAKGPLREEAVVVADIDPQLANMKLRPDGTDVIKSRRPQRYIHLTTKPIPPEPRRRAAELKAAVWTPKGCAANDNELVDVAHEAVEAGIQLLVLPELIGLGEVAEDLGHAAARSDQILAALVAACQDADIGVVTSLVARSATGCRHDGMYIDAGGIQLRQPQMHPTAQHDWAEPGEQWALLDLPWGRLGILTGDDSIFPESARILASLGADVLAVTFDVKESWETTLGLADRSAENRVLIAAATRKRPSCASLIIDQWRDFQIFTPWEGREFNGTINEPIVHHSKGKSGLFSVTIHPETAEYKLMSHETDLIQGRPWWLMGGLTQG